MGHLIKEGDVIRMILCTPKFEDADAYEGQVIQVTAEGFCMEHDGEAFAFTWSMPMMISWIES